VIETAPAPLSGGPVRGRLPGALRLLAPFLIALGAGAVVLWATGRDAFAVYGQLADAALGGGTQIADTLAATTPILFTGIATALAFRAGAFNVGVEGSLYVGAFAAAWTGFSFPHLPGAPLLALAALLAALAGAAWALLPALARAWLDVSEVVTTLMLNYVAILLTSYLVNDHFLARGVANSMSPMIAPQARLPPLLPGSQLSAALLLGLLLLAGYWFLFSRSTLGFELRLVGLAPRLARASGVDLRRSLVIAMLASGLVGGWAGGFQVLGVIHRFVDGFSPGYGFTGIAVAILGRNHPLGILAGALFFGILTSGGGMVQLVSSIPIDLVNVVQGTLMVFAVADLGRLGWLRRWAGRA